MGSLFAAPHLTRSVEIVLPSDTTENHTIAVFGPPVNEREQIIERIHELWPHDADLALAIFKCESGFKSIQSYARYPNGDRELSFGVAQIHLPAHYDAVKGDTWDEKVDNLMDWEYNLDIAHKLYHAKGWQPWSCLKLV